MDLSKIDPNEIPKPHEETFKDFWNKSPISIYIDIFKGSSDFFLRENLLYLDKVLSETDSTYIPLTIWLLDNGFLNSLGILLLEDFYTLYKTKQKYPKYIIYARAYNLVRISSGVGGLIYS